MSSNLEFRALARPLTEARRGSVRSALSALLVFQRNLARFPRVAWAPDATPIVSLYSDGAVRGSVATSEGPPRERLARAFVLALGDLRFGGIPERSRGDVAAQVAYPLGLRRISLDAAPRLIAPGAHGVALAPAGGFPVLLVPDVAREHGLDAAGLLAALEHKAGVAADEWPRGGLFTFETDRVVARSKPVRTKRYDALEAAARFLSARVRGDGSVTFGLDPRAEADETSGPMLHGRAAVVVQALGAHSAGRSAARRARSWLAREIDKGLIGSPPDGWPSEAPVVAGTLALARLAGIDVGEPLRSLAKQDGILRAPWHAAQVACALGREAPGSLWRACVRSLDADPRAPWVALAAARREDWNVFERVALALAANVRESGPHRGGVGGEAVPELALTAITIEALAPARDEVIKRAWRLARSFVERSQILGDVLPEARDPGRIYGGFSASPVHIFMRSDVTAHALIALSGVGSGRHST